MIMSPHVVAGESNSNLGPACPKASRIPATRVRVANIVTYLMNLGNSFSIRSRRELGESPRMDGVRTMTRNMAVPIQPIAASMWSQARAAFTSAKAKWAKASSCLREACWQYRLWEDHAVLRRTLGLS